MKMLNRIARVLTHNIHLNKTIGLIGFILLAFSSASFGLQSTQKGQAQPGEQLVLIQKENNQQRVSLELDNVPLISALRKVAEQVQVGFSFQEYAIPDKNVTISLSEVPVFKALNTLLKGTSLEVALSPDREVLVIREKLSKAIKVRQETITGTVTDAQSGEALPGVNVIIKGTTTGTSTGSEGNYELEVSSLQDTLVFSFIGYQTKEVPINGRTEIDISLQSQAIAGEEMVVVGYGNVKREKVTTPVSSVDPEMLQTEAVNSVTTALEGKIAGLTVRKSSGAPGSGAKLQIRGVGSIGSGSQPLFVIDGVPIDGSYVAEKSILSLLNMANVKSIDVLKGASATAIYGSRGANGVVLVETKEGIEGKTKISVSANMGWSQLLPLDKLDLMTAEEFARWRKQTAYEKAAFYGEEITDADIPKTYRNPESLGKGTDWQDVITQLGPRQNYDVSVSHGTKNFTGYFSMGYTDETGIIKATGFERLSFRANIGYEPNEAVKFKLKISPTLRTWEHMAGGYRGSKYAQTLINTPVDGPYKEDGPWERGNPSFYDGNWDLDIWSPGTFSSSNPLYGLTHTYDKSNDMNFLVTPSLEIKPFKFLSLRTYYNARYTYGKEEFFKPSTISSIYGAPPGEANGHYNTDRRYNWQWGNTATFTNSYGDHNVSILLGATIEHYKHSWNNLYGSNYPRDDIRTINAALEQTGSSGESNWSMISYFGRLKYDYKAKYLLTASVRRDGSSRFGSGNRWAIFPALSAAWNVTNEEFFPENIWLTNLKLRVGYGMSGNNDIGNYTWIPNLVENNYTFGGTVVNGMRISAIKNRLLGWQTVKEYSVGLDLSLWERRVRFHVDYYDRTTEDMLWQVAIPISSGFSSISDNIGKIKNRGFEFSLETHNISNPNFSWSTDFNITINRNEVINLGAIDRILRGWKDYSLTKPGHPMAMFYGYKFIGVLQDREDVKNSATFPGQLPGTVKFKDLDGNGVINLNDKKFIGNPYPAFRGGFNNTFKYKNFDLSVAMSFAYKFDVFGAIETEVLNYDGVFNVLDVTKKRWRSPDEPGNGVIPTSIHQTYYSREPNSKLVYSDVSFLKVQNITLGYTFDKIQFLDSFRAYCSIQNALTLTQYPFGYPDASSATGSSLTKNYDEYGYPLSRTITLGINLTF